MQTIWLDTLGAEVRFRGSKYKTRSIEYGAGPPLFLLHGVGGHAEAYSRNIRGLGKAHRAMALDFLWHGLSSKPDFDEHMIDAFCRQLIDVLDAMGEPKASIEGESLGGWVGLWFALHYADRLDKLILNTTAGIKYDEANVRIDHAGGREQLRARSLAAIQNPTRETIRKRLEWLMASPDRVTTELESVRFAIYSDPETQASLTRVFEHTFSPASEQERILEENLARVTCPTLVLWSDKNPGTGPDAGARLAKLIPNAQFVCIADAAHWPQWEQPQAHDDAVAAFLSGVPAVH